jgi:hypothetical protein
VRCCRARVWIEAALDRLVDARTGAPAAGEPRAAGRPAPGGPTVLRTALEAGPGSLPRWVAELDALLAADPPVPVTG